MQPAAEAEVPARRRLAVGAAALCDHADPALLTRAPPRAAHVVPDHAGAAVVRAGERREDAHGGGLARPVRTQ